MDVLKYNCFLNRSLNTEQKLQEALVAFQRNAGGGIQDTDTGHRLRLIQTIAAGLQVAVYEDAVTYEDESAHQVVIFVKNAGIVIRRLVDKWSMVEDRTETLKKRLETASKHNKSLEEQVCDLKKKLDKTCLKTIWFYLYVGSLFLVVTWSFESVVVRSFSPLIAITIHGGFCLFISWIEERARPRLFPNLH